MNVFLRSIIDFYFIFKKIIFFTISLSLGEEYIIKDRILADIKNLFEHDKEEANYYKPVTVSNFWSNNYIEYGSNGDRNKTLSSCYVRISE